MTAPYKVGETNVVPVTVNFDNQPMGVEMLLSDQAKKLLEDYIEAGIEIVLAPSTDSGKLIGFGIVPVQRAARKTENSITL